MGLVGLFVEFKAKNFRLPMPLVQIWDRYFNPKGSRISSRHAGGAVFLYWVMPDPIRHIAAEAAQQSDPEAARRWFFDQLTRFELDARVAKAVIAAAEAGAIQQEETGEKKAGSRTRS